MTTKETLISIRDELIALDLDGQSNEEPSEEPPAEPPVETPSDLPTVKLNFDQKTGLFNIMVNSLLIVEAHYSFWNKDMTEWYGMSTDVTEADDGYSIVGTTPEMGLTLNMEALENGKQYDWDMEIVTDTLINDTMGGGIEFKFEGVEVTTTDKSIFVSGEFGKIEIRFEHPPAYMYDQGALNKRAFLIYQQVAVETQYNKMSVILPENGVIVQPIMDQLGGEPDDTWNTNIIEAHVSPVNMNLNDDMGHGFLRAVGEDLVFEDGTEFIGWGNNVSSHTIFSALNENIIKHAKRIADLGHDIVRFHHHDSHWVRPNIFGPDGLSKGTLSSNAFEKLDLWINELKKHGVYIFMDIHVGRWWQETDGIDNYEEVVKRDKRGFGFNYINADVERLMQEFAESYLTHENNGVRYLDDPAVIGICITNENDITHHFGHALDDNPVSRAKFMALMEGFRDDNSLPIQPMAPWLPGASQKALNDIEHRYNERNINHLKDLGVKAPMVTTQSWACSTKSLPALMDSDLIDVHAYERSGFLNSNPIYNSNIAHWIGYNQINGMPLSCTEWNMEGFPDDFDRVVLPMFVAAVGCLQGWNSLYHFDYASSFLKERPWHTPTEFQAHNDPSMLALMPAAALMFRKRHVKKAQKTYAYSVDHETFFSNFARPSESAAFRTIIEQSRFVVDVPETPELPWLNPAPLPADVIKFTDTNESFLSGGTKVISDTGELIRDFDKGQYFIDTPLTQAVMGWIEGTHMIGDITVEMETKFAAVVVQSLDGLPVNMSNKLFITIAGRSYPSWVPRDDGTGYWGHPMRSEPIKGEVRIRHSGGLNGTYENGEYIIEPTNTYWYYLERA